MKATYNPKGWFDTKWICDICKNLHETKEKADFCCSHEEKIIHNRLIQPFVQWHEGRKKCHS